MVALASGGGIAVLWDIVLAHGEGAVPSVAYWATWAGVHLAALAGAMGLVRHFPCTGDAPSGTEIVAEILGPEEDEHEAEMPRHAPWPSDERQLRG